MIASIAWKNVWRNKTRSFTVITAVTIGVFAGIFSMAAINSSVVQRIDSAVNEELSHIQINNKDFRNSADIQNLIQDPALIFSVLDSTKGVSGYTGRIILRGMAASSAKSTGVEIVGVDVAKEKQIFTLANKLIPGTGSYLEEDKKTKYNTVYIGEKLAKELNVIRYILTEESVNKLKSEGVPEKILSEIKPLIGIRFTSDKKFKAASGNLLSARQRNMYGLKIQEAAWSYREGSKIRLTFLDINNNQTGGNFRVCGIFRTNNDMFEELSLFVPIEELRTLTGIPEGGFHRIIARLDDNDLTNKVTPQIRESLPQYEVMNWKEIQPDLAMIVDFINLIYSIFMVIILAALAFGIVNTMLMAVLERTRELGMLAAIGMNRYRIFTMIMLESIFLSIVGGIAGMVLSEVVILITSRTGINLVKYSDGMEAMGYSAHLYPTIDTQFFIITTILIVLTGVISSIYPARKALSLNPVEAIRGE